MIQINTDIKKLQQKSDSIDDFKEAKKIISNLQMILAWVGNRGIGISAPQIDIYKQILYIQWNGQKITMINPVIKKQSKEKWKFVESCLSLPGEEVEIERSKKIIVEYIKYNGEKVTGEFEDILARCILHEINHLQGVLIIDYK